ncbi:MAG: hypothetical protein ACR2LI_16315 [Propionibacteriaceae bacterium]
MTVHHDDVGVYAAPSPVVAGGISDHPWGRIAAFKDSEGNDLRFYGPPQD